MRVESIAERTLGLKDHRVVAVEEEGDELTAKVDVRRCRRLPCSGCGKRRRLRDRLSTRRWKHVPLWGIGVTIVYRPARVKCRQCGVKVEKLPWATGKSPLADPLILVLATWARLLAWQVVAKLFGVSWNTVKAAVGRAVEFGLREREEGGVLYVGIDEISRRRGHIYHTQVYDLSQKRLLWSGEGREADTLRRFFDEWGPEKTAAIKAFCCDMWNPYAEVIGEKAPNALIVFDKFHLVRHLLAAVNDVRKAEVRELEGTQQGQLLKGTRYIWLKNPWNLTPHQKRRLGSLQRLNLKINRAYFLKEAFLCLWAYPTRREAERYLKQWFWWATHSRLRPIRDFARMLRRHLNGVLAYFQIPLDGGATEAMNNNAKAVSHRARGYRTAKTFTLSLLHCLGKLPLPATLHKFV